MSGVLAGLKVLEFAAIGPVPWAGMLLADFGASIVRVERPGSDAETDTLGAVRRGRMQVELDLKSSAGREAARTLIRNADVVLEGLRPGVMERLGLGPEDALQLNPRIVYGRMTGWGQEGPLAQQAGHDINYIALTGALHAIGPAQKPVPPLNLVGDFGGGGAFLLMGLLAALWQVKASGRGQVVDAAMVDGAASLMAMVYSRTVLGQWKDERASNPLDGGREEIAPVGVKLYNHRLMDYNNDPKTTFADIQGVFWLLEKHIAMRLANPQSALASPSTAASVSKADLQVARRLRELLGSPAKWNRNDTDCLPDAKTMNLICAFEKAEKEVTGAAQDGAAINEARVMISELDPNRAKYKARLVDYNADPAVTFADLQKFLSQLEARLAARITAK